MLLDVSRILRAADVRFRVGVSLLGLDSRVFFTWIILSPRRRSSFSSFVRKRKVKRETGKKSYFRFSRDDPRGREARVSHKSRDERRARQEKTKKKKKKQKKQNREKREKKKKEKRSSGRSPTGDASSFRVSFRNDDTRQLSGLEGPTSFPR